MKVVNTRMINDMIKVNVIRVLTAASENHIQEMKNIKPDTNMIRLKKRSMWKPPKN